MSQFFCCLFVCFFFSADHASESNKTATWTYGLWYLSWELQQKRHEEKK